MSNNDSQHTHRKPTPFRGGSFTATEEVSYNPEKIIETSASKVHPSFFGVVQQRAEIKQALSGIKHKIGVYSAKGGVGKTTVAVNLAYALKELGYSVGLIDADVDCPNVTFFTGLDAQMKPEYPLEPVNHKGVKIVSTAMLTDSRNPIIWRGPIAAKMIADFLKNTDWGKLDYLLIDLPPGTSDVPLSIMQLLSLDGIVLVTTPQHISAINAIRSGIMAKRFGINLYGVVENMSNGSPTGSKEVAEELKCDLLGSVAEDKKLSDFADAGRVPVLEDEDAKKIFIGIAEKLIRVEV